ncbi:hypothetical protein ACVWWO_003230 [Bradyrhizobium sp. F1.13.1]
MSDAWTSPSLELDVGISNLCAIVLPIECRRAPVETTSSHEGA